MLQRQVRTAATRPALLTVVALILGGSLPASAGAASATTTTPPPPESTATCYGSLTPAPTADEPDLLNYEFQCNARTTAYTIIANRTPSDFSVLDDFSPTALVVDPDGTTVNTKTIWSCVGVLPGDGINCNTGAATTYVGSLSYTEGSIDTTDPYCKNLPTGAKPGTPAEPQALVQLVVSDTSGAEDGPFKLGYKGKCPKVPDKVPGPVKSKGKTHGHNAGSSKGRKK